MTRLGPSCSCFPKLCSALLPGGGESTSERLRLHNLHCGTLATLAWWGVGHTLGQPTRPARTYSGQLSDEQRCDFATGLARDGFDKKACTALLSSGQCEPGAPRSLHPVGQPPPTRALPDLLVAPALDKDAVAKAVGSSPADTAPGPTGLRVQHLRVALGQGAGTGFLEQFAAVVNHLVQGHAPNFGAGLVALATPAGAWVPLQWGSCSANSLPKS